MKIVVGLLLVVVLVVGVILALPFLIDLNKYQDQYKPTHRRRAQSQGSAARHPPDYLAADRCPGGRVRGAGRPGIRLKPLHLSHVAGRRSQIHAVA